MKQSSARMSIKLAAGGLALSLGLLASTLGPAARGAAAFTAQPDLVISSITESADPVNVNQEFGYLVSVKNQGTAFTSGIRVSGTVSNSGGFAGPLFGTHGFGGCTTSGTTWTCTGGQLGAGVEGVITVPVKAPAAAGIVTINATVDPANTIAESNDANNARSASTVIGLADLKVNIIESKATVDTGEEFHYTFESKNQGSRSATNVQMRATFGTATALSVVQTTDGFSCAIAANVLTCTGGMFSVNDTATVRVKVRAPMNPGSIVVHAVMDPNGLIPESNNANNSDTETTQVVRRADLRSSISGTDAVASGAEASFTAVVRNIGDGTANNSRIRITTSSMPLHVTSIDILGSTHNGSCAIVDSNGAGGARVECTGVDLPANQQITIRVFVEFGTILFPGTGTVRVSADPNGALTESNEGNNVATMNVSFNP